MNRINVVFAVDIAAFVLAARAARNGGAVHA